MSNTTNIYIQRPALPATGYTALPNTQFDCSALNLKPRDLAVLNYLLTKRADWKIRVSDIAKHCRISKNTVYAALKVLQQLGIARWERLKTGMVNWFIHVPDHPATPLMVEPDTKKPHPQKPDTNFEQVLTKNNKKPNIEKTTTAPPENLPICENQPICELIIDEPVVVVTQEPVLVLPVAPTTTTTTESPDITPDLTVLDVLDEKEKNIVTNELKKVTDLTAQAVILFTLKTTIANNKVKDSPIALARGLIKKAIDGVLVTKYVVAKMKSGQTASTPPVDDYRAQRIMRIRNLAAKHPECIEEMKKKGRFTFPSDTRYLYLPNDFREAGLI